MYDMRYYKGVILVIPKVEISGWGKILKKSGYEIWDRAASGLILENADHWYYMHTPKRVSYRCPSCPADPAQSRRETFLFAA